MLSVPGFSLVSQKPPLFDNLQSEYIHYLEGFLLAPGYIDLSGLLFVTADGDGTEVDDDTDGTRPTDQSSASNDKKGNGNRNDRRRNRFLKDSQDKDYYVEGSAVDIAVFHLVSTLLLQEISVVVRRNLAAGPRRCIHVEEWLTLFWA